MRSLQIGTRSTKLARWPRNLGQRRAGADSREVKSRNTERRFTILRLYWTGEKRFEEGPRNRNQQPIVEVIENTNTLKTEKAYDRGHNVGEHPRRVLETERKNLVKVGQVLKRKNPAGAWTADEWGREDRHPSEPGRLPSPERKAAEE